MDPEHALTLEQALEKVRTYKAIIFDNDGTLVDSMPVHYTAWRDALQHFGITFTEEQFYSLAGVPANEIIALLTEEQGKAPDDVSVSAVLEHRQERLENVLKHISKIDVVVHILNDAVSRGIPVAVASGGEQGDVLASMAYAGVDDSVFKAIVTREDVSRGKPDPETFLLAAEKLAVDPQDCIGLEDGAKGLEALDNAGIGKMDVRQIEGYPVPDVLKK